MPPFSIAQHGGQSAPPTPRRPHLDRGTGWGENRSGASRGDDDMTEGSAGQNSGRCCGDSAPRPFLAILDEERLSIWAILLLLVTAAALSRYYLGVNVPFIRPMIVGREAMPVFPLPWTEMLSAGIATSVISFAVGVIAGSAVRRSRWAVGPCVIAAVALYNMLGLMLLWSIFDGRGLGWGEISGWELDFRAWSVLGMAGALVFAGIGGALSPRVARHIRPGTVATAALAWIGAAWIGSLLRSCFIAGWEDVAISEWSLPWLLMAAERAVPYLVAAWFLRSATKMGSLWVPTLVVGAMPALQAFRGWVSFGTDTAWESVLRYVLWVGQPLVWAMAGAWLAGAMFGLGSRRQLVRQAAAVVAAAVIVVALSTM